MTNSVPDLRCLALRLLSASLIALLLLTLPVLSHADPVVRYAAPAPLGSGDCSSWADACSLQTALASAGSGDEVWVLMGVHKPTDTTDRTISFALPTGVAVYGGFAGTETQLAERDWQTNLTILSGDIDNNDLTDPTGVVTDTANIVGANSFHVVMNPANNTGWLDGFIITAGQADGSLVLDQDKGGGLYSDIASSLTVVNTVFSGNMAYDGGGMYCEGHSQYSRHLTLTNVIFAGNTAVQYGGGFNNSGNSLTLTHVQFLNNSAGWSGGGMLTGSPDAVMTDLIFSGNTATDYGGGLSHYLGSLTLTEATFSNNTAFTGGGMYNKSDPANSNSPTLTAVTFQDNDAVLGGGLYTEFGGLTLTDIVFTGNTAVYGGGVHSYTGSPTLTNLTFAGNTADYGGGMYFFVGSPVLTGVNFTQNSATQNGGGLYSDEDSTAALYNVIFNENTADNLGGGMSTYASNPTLNGVTFDGNWADMGGGGMYNYLDSNPNLTNVTFSGNQTNLTGGGMFNEASSNPTLTAVTFEGNVSLYGSGGAMLNDDSTPTLTNVTLRENSAGAGGGIYNYLSSPVLLDVSFSANSGQYGGGMYNNASSPTLTGVSFRGNSVTGSGGGLRNINDSHPSLVNVVFAGNTANLSGGGVYNSLNSNPTLTNVTFSDNTAVSYDGGALYNGDNSNPLVDNSILWGNSAGRNGDEIFNGVGSVPTLAYSDVQGSGGSGSGWDTALGVDGGGNLDADPRFVALAAGDLRLGPDSPAIDAGDNTAVPPGIVTDLDGRSRFVDIPFIPDSGSGTPPIVDMGAYEASFADLSLAKTVTPAIAAPGEMLTFTLTLANSSSLTVTQVVLTDTLPAHLSPQAVLASGVTITDTGVSPAFVWRVADLAPGQTGVITLSAILTTPLAAGTYTNTARISAANDAWPLNNSASVTYTVANLAPVFTSTAVLTATQDAPYIYTIATSDGNGDPLTISAPVLPDWLSLIDHGDGTAVLSGTPARADVGDHAVVLRVTDGNGLYSNQAFSVTVLTRPAFTLYLPLVINAMR